MTLKPTIALAAALLAASLSYAPALAASPNITFTDASVTPTSSTGPCPAVFTFSTKITASGFSPTALKQIQYKWIRSDNANAPIQTVNANADGVVSIPATETWTLSPPTYSGWEAVQIVYPQQLTGPHLEFKLDCAGNTTGNGTGKVPTEAQCMANNMLKNGDFKTSNPPGHTSYNGALAETASAAADWTLFNNLSPTSISTEWLSSYKGRSGVIHVTSNQTRSGLEQVIGNYGTGPAHAQAYVSVYIASGSVGMGTGNGGNTGIDAQSSDTGKWVMLTAPNGATPANEFIIYATATTGADFYVNTACVVPNPVPEKPMISHPGSATH